MVPTDDCFADLLIGDSALLLYYNESRTRSRNYVIVHGFVNFYVCIYLFMSSILRFFKVIVAMISWNWVRWQLSMRRWYVRDINVRLREILCYVCMFIILCLQVIFLNTLLYHPISSFQNIYLILPNFLVRLLSSLGFIFVAIYHVFELRENRVSISSIGGNLKTLLLLQRELA